MNKKSFKIICTIFIIAIMCLNPKVFATEDNKVINQESYNESYTIQELIERGEINPQIEENNNITNFSRNETQNILTAKATTEEDMIYKTVYGNTDQIYVTADSKNDYFVTNTITIGQYGKQYYELVRHDIVNNTNTTIYTSKDTHVNIATYVSGNIIYVEEAPYKEYNEGDYTEVYVTGFDISKDEVVYEGKFDVTVSRDDYFPTFAVDSKQRFYFVNDFTGTKVFDNKGTLIYEREPIEVSEQAQYEIVIHSITPNDEGMIFSLGYYNYPPYAYLKTDHIGFQSLKEDGKFENDNYTLFGNSIGTYYVEDPLWKFIDEEGKYAVNQYGQIAKFDYTADNTCGVNIEIIDDTLGEVVDATMGYLANPSYFTRDNKLYLLGANNIIYVFDINNNFERIGKIETGIETPTQYDKIYRITNIGEDIYIKYYKTETGTRDRKISLNSIEEFKNIWYTEHITQTHSKKDIIAKYKETAPKFDYTKNMFSIEPSFKSPYVAGKLKDEVVNDTLNQINYFRWLYGINEVEINEDKMERSQKGAVVQAANNEMSHTPKKPADMSQEFYDEAYAGCNASAEEGDSYNGNCSYGDQSTTSSIAGYVSDLNNVTIGSYVGHRLNILDTDVTKTSFGYCNGYTALSMYYGENDTNNNEQFYAYPSAGNFPMQNFTTDEYWSFLCRENYYIKDMKIEFTYNNKTYTQEKRSVEGSAIVFKMPDELINELGGKGKQMPQAKINVKLTGMTNDAGDTINYNYDVNFFDINEILITGISFNNKTETAYEGRTISAQSIKIEPSNATEKYEIEWSSSNTDIATIDKDGKITCKKIGTTTITAKIGEFTTSYTLEVKEAPPYTLGDINEDGQINARDAKLALQYYVGKIDLTETQKLAADVNEDGEINARDAKLILQYYVGK